MMSNLKKTIYILLLTFVFLISFCKVVKADEVTYDNRTIIIGGDNYFPPFEYVDRNGVYRGFNVDIMRAIAIEMGIDIEIKLMPWHETVIQLQNKNIDAIQGMKYSETRDYLYDFSKPYLVSSQAIFVRENNKHIVNLEDLQNKKVAVQKNDISVDVLSKMENIQIIETENQEMAIEKLINIEVDAYVGNRLTGLYIIQKNGFQKEIKIVGEEINPQNYCIAVSEGNHDLLKVFDEGLKRIKENGTYDKIYKKWFGQPIGPSYGYVKKILYFSFGVLLFLVLIIFVFYRWNHLLKIEVRKRTEELARESLFKEQTLNSIFSGLITFNDKGVILWANEKALRFLDCTSAELIGKHYRDTVVEKYFYEEDFQYVLQTGIEKMNKEKTIKSNDENRIFEYNLYPLVFSKGKIYGVTLTFKDITNEKLMREKIIVKDKLESLGRLVAGIAHEIRNPLTSIKTYIELIPLKYDIEEFRDKISQDVPREIERLNTIINNLLDYSRPKKPFKELFSIKESVTNITGFFHATIESKKINLEVDIEDDLYIYIDKQQFTQIIINFLLNAIEAVENADKPLISISAQSIASQVHIIIEDNGYGIKEENINTVFEPFFTTKTNGTGLGLSISYQFIKENGGEVNIQSELGSGTKIDLIFPQPDIARSEING